MRLKKIKLLPEGFQYGVLAGLGAALFSVACEQKPGGGTSGAPVTVDAGLDRRANSSISLSGTMTGDGSITTTWSSSSKNVHLADPASLTSQVTADADGTYVITLVAKDSTGKEIADSMTFEWDTTAPDSPSLSKVTGSQFSKSTGLSVTIISPPPGDLGSYRFAVGSQPLASCDEGTETSGEITVPSTIDVALAVVACDNLGNMSTPTFASFVCSDCNGGDAGNSDAGNGEAGNGDAGDSDAGDSDAGDSDGSEPSSYVVTTNSPANLTVTPSAVQTVTSGNSLTYSLTPEPHFQVHTSSLPGGTCPAGSWNGTQYTTGPIGSNCSIEFAAGDAIPNYSVTAAGVFDYPSGYPAQAKTWDPGQLVADANKTVEQGGTVSFTVNLPTAWHRVVTNVPSGCPSGSWARNTYTTGAITANCSIVLHVDTGETVTFSQIRTILGTKTKNSSSYVSGSVVDVTAPSSACINCHSKAVENAGTTAASAPSGQFSMTSTNGTDVTACDTAPYADANECRAVKVDYSKLTDNLRWDTKIKAQYTSGSDVVTVTDTARLAVGNRIDNTAFPAASSVTILEILASNQVRVSANASATGTLPINVVLSTSSPATKILQRDEVFYCNTTQCWDLTYRRVDPGSPQTSLICIKPQASVKFPSAAGGLTNNLAGGWLDALKPAGFTFANTSGFQPRDRVMPYMGNWYIGDDNVDKICRWILQGAQNI